MVDQFVFGFERLAFSGTLFPEADMIGLLGSSNVLHRDMGDQLVHGAESFVARLFGVGQLLGLNPLTDEFLLDGLPHVSEEGPGSMVGSHVHVHRAIAMELGGGVVLGPGAGDLSILVGSAIHVPGEAQPHLPVHHVGGAVSCRLLMQPREDKVSGGVGVSVRSSEPPRRGEEAVLGAGGFPEAPVSE